MRFSLASLSLFALGLVQLTSAKIIGFEGPKSSVTAKEEFIVTFLTEDYITNNEQYYAIFGLTTSKNVGNSIGSETQAHKDIYKYASVAQRNFSIPIQLEDAGTGKQTLTTAVFGQVGASGGITVQYFNASIDIVS